MAMILTFLYSRLRVFKLMFVCRCFLCFMFSKMSGPSYRTVFLKFMLSKGETSCQNPVNLSKPHNVRYLSFVA